MDQMDDTHAHSEHDSASFERIVAETSWGELSARLLGYARYRLSRYRGVDPTIGDRAADYVQEAIARFLDRTRSYDGKKPLFHWFCSQIDSLTSHDREKAMRRGPEIAIDQLGDENTSERSSSDDWAASADDLEQAIIARDELEHFVSSLDPDLRRYVLLRVHGAQMTAEEYAVAMGTTVERIRNFDRRLRRRRQLWAALTTNRETRTRSVNWRIYA